MATTNDQTKNLESHRHSHLNLRQRVISTWVRDALKRDTASRKDETRRLDDDNFIDGDVRNDAMLVTERYETTSIEWRSFRILYGLAPEDVGIFDIVYKLPLYSFGC